MLQPNATLYIKNIDWKINKNLVRRSLYSLFTRHGKVFEIIALRKDGLRGQAFIIMDSIQAATSALLAEQGFTFFGKDLVIEYAKEVSNRMSRFNGTYTPQSTTTKGLLSSSSSNKKKRKIENSGDNPTTTKRIQDEEDLDQHDNDENPTAIKENADDPTTSTMLDENENDTSPPSRILLAQNLPMECNEMVLSMLFQQYTGYKEVRVPRPGLAFIEFVDEIHATLARTNMNGFKLTPTDSLNLMYGKA